MESGRDLLEEVSVCILLKGLEDLYLSEARLQGFSNTFGL